MSRLALASSVLVAAEAGTLKLTWSDCGSTHGKVTGMSPTSFSTGTEATITGTGTIDEDVTAATIKATISALGTKLSDCSGDGKTDIVCNLPLNTGTITVPALPFPLAKGTLNLPVKVKTSASIPASLASVDIHLTGDDQNGESAICLDAHTEASVSSGNWEEFKAKYGKVYNGPDHEAEHKSVYEKNMQWAAENSDEQTTFGENQFADLTQEQYRVAAGLGYKASSLSSLPHLGVHVHNGEELAASVDWTTKGAVTAVKDQGQCGSCWAFSTTGGLEGAWQIASGSLKSLSEQQFVDCDKNGSAGCQGGDMATAFQWAENQALATEQSYPYTARDGSCKSSGWTTAIPQGGVTGYKSVGQSTADLKSALNLGPVSVAIEADQMAFQMYSGGVLKSGCGTNLDHGVLAVGYTADAFKVKNSWGSSWGASGYLQISTQGNVCGIHSEAQYPTVSASVAV